VNDFNEENNKEEDVTFDSTNRNMQSNTNKRQIIPGKIIPADDNVIILIENIWIETHVNLGSWKIHI
jgi:hypothetical protein